MEQIVMRFEDAWRQGPRPSIADYLPAGPDQRRAVLLELVHVELELRLKDGEAARVESYLDQYPELRDDPIIVFELIAAEYKHRSRWAPPLEVAEYLQRFPEHVERLQRWVAGEQTTDSSAGSVPSTATPVPPAVTPSTDLTVRLTRTPNEPPPPSPSVSNRGPGLDSKRPANATDWPVIAGYETLSQLGAGGMGIVYKARELELDRIVALKVIRRDLLSSVDAVERFRREAMKTAQLLHPHIVIVYAAGRSGDTHFYAMEYVEGIDLKHLVEQLGRLEVWRACEYIRQTALGLQHAHERGMVHRDIKPANLIVTLPALDPTPLAAAGTPPAPAEPCPSRGSIIKILDLGLARWHRFGDPNSDSTLTSPGGMMGTLDFIAPEQAEDARQADIRADVYGLGCTLYYLLSGQVPYPGGNWIEKVNRHRTDRPRPLSQLRPDLPPGIEQVVDRLMANRREERYQTPAEVVAAMEPFRERPAHRSGSTSGVIRLTTLIRNMFRRFSGHTDLVLSVAFSPDGRRALSGSADGTVRLWNVENGQQLRCFTGHRDFVLSVAFSPDGLRAVSAGCDRTVRLWDVQTGRELRCFSGHIDLVWSVAFSPDGRRVLSGSGGTVGPDGTVTTGTEHTARLWDAITGAELRRFEGHTNHITHVCFSRNGRRALSASADRTVRLWNVHSGRELNRFEGHTDLIWNAAFSPAGRQVLSVSQDGTLRWWDVLSAQQLHCFSVQSESIESVAVSADGRRALCGAADGSVWLWDVHQGKKHRSFDNHKGPVLCVAFSPDEHFALSGGADKTLRLYPLPKT
jgi:serine/threonine protein kinase